METSGVRLLPAVLPCATIAGIATLTNTTLLTVNRKINTKKTKHSRLVLLAQKAKHQLQTLINKIADDDKVDVKDESTQILYQTETKFNFKNLNECKIRAADVDWWLGGVNPINDVTYNFNL